MMSAIADRAGRVSPSERGAQGAATLRVIPIVGPSHEQPEYRVLERAIMDAINVTEVSEGGSVPRLRIENTLDERVFLMDGQGLIGAKQNRILNTDVLVPAKAIVTIPVSCVEAGRWRYATRCFMPDKAASYAVRSRKMTRVHESLKKKGVHDADQGAVWQDVDASMQCAGVLSPTAALHDAYAQRERELEDFRRDLQMPADAVGMAVFRGGRLLGLDLFDRASTFHHYWTSLVDSYAIDWLLAEPTRLPIDPQPGAHGDDPDGAVIRDALSAAGCGAWDRFAAPPGAEGADYRLSHERLVGSALVWEESVVLHLQMFQRPDDQAR
jgi:hypothetical protein